MCGFIVYTGKNPTIHNLVKQNIRLLDHRGGDGAISCKDINGGIMAHNLLSITGYSPAKQPFLDHASANQAVVNGEFYNYAKIRADLERWGTGSHNIKTQSDSELLLHVYRRYEDFMTKLEGEFAFVIYDSWRKQYVVARDRFGVKPLYYTKVEDGYVFASEIKAFQGIVKLEYDEYVLNQVLSVQYEPPTHSMYKNIYKVESSHMMVVSHDGQLVSNRPYWFPERTYDDSITADVVRETVSAAIKRRLEGTTKKVGISLSGGLDSSILASQAAEYDPTFYTIAYGDKQYDEVADASLSTFGQEHKVIRLSEGAYVGQFEKAVVASEGLCMNNHLVSKYFLFKHMADDGVKITMDGTGADELFMGYAHFRQQLGVTPDSSEGYLSGLHFSQRDMANESITSPFGNYCGFLNAKLATSTKMRESLFNSNWQLPSFMGLGRLPKMQNEVEGAAYMWCKHGLEGYILSTLGDRLEMAHNIEGRIPFLDTSVAELAYRIPMEQKIKDGVEKHILKEAFRGIVPDAIINKRKHPFLAPPMLNNTGFQELFFDVITSKEMEFLIDSSKASDIIKQISRGNIDKASYDPIAMLLTSMYFLRRNNNMGSVKTKVRNYV